VTTAQQVYAHAKAAYNQVGVRELGLSYARLAAPERRTTSRPWL
jgi:hypothetical protein